MNVRAFCLSMVVLLAGVSIAAAAPEDDVLAASEQFYAALNDMLQGDAAALADVWSHGENVTTMHPVGGREVGWEQVRASWENVANLASDGMVELKDRRLRIVGNLAYEVGTEKGHFKLGGHEVAGFEGRVTNIYEREKGAWKIVHHHVDVSPAMVDVLSQIPPPDAEEE